MTNITSCRVFAEYFGIICSSRSLPQNDFHCFHCPFMNWAKYRMPGCTWSSSEPSRFMVTPPKAATKTESYMSILANKRCPQSFETSKWKICEICDHVLEYDLKNAQVLLCALHHVATTLGRGYSSDQLCFWFLRWIHRYVIELVSSRQHCNTLDLGLWRERKHLQAPSQALRPLHIRSHKCMIYNKAFGIAADCGKHAFFQKRSKGHFRIKRNRKYQNRTYHRIQEDQADHEDQYAQIVVCSYQ